MIKGDSMSLEDIKVALDSNPNLTDEIRDNLYSLTFIFNKEFPNIDLSNLFNHLKTLKIEKSSKFVNKRVSKYNCMTNTLELNLEKMNEGYDMKHVLMFELLNMITNNNEYTGFNKNDKFRALNAGYTEMIANYLVGNDSDISYLEDEVISTNMISYIVGSETMFDAYFNNDATLLTNKMLEKGFGD